MEDSKILTRHEAFKDYFERITADPAAFKGHLEELHAQLGALKRYKRNARESMRAAQRAIAERNNIIRRRNTSIEVLERLYAKALERECALIDGTDETVRGPSFASVAIGVAVAILLIVGMSHAFVP